MRSLLTCFRNPRSLQLPRPGPAGVTARGDSGRAARRCGSRPPSGTGGDGGSGGAAPLAEGKAAAAAPLSRWPSAPPCSSARRVPAAAPRQGPNRERRGTSSVRPGAAPRLRPPLPPGAASVRSAQGVRTADTAAGTGGHRCPCGGRGKGLC